MSQAAWWQYLFPAAAIVLVAVLWALRRRWRGPLAGVLFFVGTLLPVLGFFNVYPFRYSFVADHFQYLASLGIIVLVSAGLALLLQRWQVWGRPAGYAMCFALLATLAGLTWRQCRMYADIETLYETTIARNPDCWLAHDNLGHLLEDRGELNQAIEHYRKAVEAMPSDDDSRVSLGAALAHRGESSAAITQFEKALEFTPDSARRITTLAGCWPAAATRRRRVEHYHKALNIKPDYAEAHNNLGAVLAERGELEAAVAELEQALALKPDYPLANLNLANAFAAKGRSAEAREHYEEALAQARAHNDNAMVEVIRSRFAGNQ